MTVVVCVGRLVGCTAAGIIVLIGIGLLSLQVHMAWSVPPAPRPITSSARLFDCHGKVLDHITHVSGRWSIPVAYEDVASAFWRALVAIEDHRYERHQGVDWFAWPGALWSTVCKGRRRGASTIPMQLVRLRRPQDRSLWYKWQQVLGALHLSRRYDKKTLLVEYANRTSFGGNIVGIEAAAQAWFGCRARDLTLPQAVFLAGMPQNPEGYRPDRQPLHASRRRSEVAQRMSELGLLSGAELLQVLQAPLPQRKRSLRQHEAKLPAGMQAAVLAAMSRSGTVASTFDPSIGGLVEQLVRPEVQYDGHAAVVVAEMVAGQALVRVAWSSSDELDLTQRARSTGSLLKPFIYGLAYAAGYCSSGTLLPDRPRSWGEWRPQNSDGRFLGNIAAGKALAQSRNLPALVVLERVGVRRLLRFLLNNGLEIPGNESSYGLSLAIGGAELSPRAVTKLYACLLAGGNVVPLHDRANKGQVFSGRVLPAYVCEHILGNLATYTRTQQLHAPAADCGIAWKTGTSNGYRDAWAVACSRRWVVTVWRGRLDGRRYQAQTGTNAAAPLALTVIAQLQPGEDRSLWRADSLAQPIQWQAAKVRQLRIEQPMGKMLKLQSGDSLTLRAAGGKQPYQWTANGRIVKDPRNWRPAGRGSYRLTVLDSQGRATQRSIVITGGAPD